MPINVKKELIVGNIIINAIIYLFTIKYDDFSKLFNKIFVV